MTSPARREREALAELLLKTGPDAPTLCGDWTTRDLAAHMTAREHRPDSGPGILVSAFSAWTERVRRRYARMDYERLVELFRNPPRWSPGAWPAADQAVNTLEFFVHHEDVRRAAPDWKPRELDRETQEALWARTKLARLLLRRTGMTVKLEAPGYGQRTFGKGKTDAVVSGDPGEVIMFCLGRQNHSRARVEGGRAEELSRAWLGF
ncbi:MAG: TIGR03085 family metal-binding protein [Stackebrandtia sp.]